jgi:hypothetical protein
MALLLNKFDKIESDYEAVISARVFPQFDELAVHYPPPLTGYSMEEQISIINKCCNIQKLYLNLFDPFHLVRINAHSILSLINLHNVKYLKMDMYSYDETLFIPNFTDLRVLIIQLSTSCDKIILSDSFKNLTKLKYLLFTVVPGMNDVQPKCFTTTPNFLANFTKLRKYYPYLFDKNYVIDGSNMLIIIMTDDIIIPEGITQLRIILNNYGQSSKLSKYPLPSTLEYFQIVRLLNCTPIEELVKDTKQLNLPPALKELKIYLERYNSNDAIINVLKTHIKLPHGTILKVKKDL